MRAATGEEFSLAELQEIARDWKAAQPAMSDEELGKVVGGSGKGGLEITFVRKGPGDGYTNDAEAKWHIAEKAHAGSAAAPPRLPRVLNLLSASLAPEIKS